MSSALKHRIKPGIDEKDGLMRRNHSCTDGNHIGIVMFLRQLDCLYIPANSRSNTRDIIGDHGFAITTASKYNSVEVFFTGNTFSGRSAIIGIITRNFTMGAEINGLIPF